ncbi:adenosylmethionine--8-amino-7-oxononanoate transaminase [Capnocytophaga gingivalis]|uniref:Adenosylmethionine-8-amino-7-oxononanoate aminotransferase n=1 Tax=Capnocytophaga gingivalis TaxID=1017 RepID=A0A250FRA7_9FLAO|nr:adenosylmethionine--8-amino-7-oxononanoate transaminase [Capnocytophaga gingivalis]ATA87712.1 adenosylmethionine--8-amino-7-oxononanoate transaminase [Capnocytophaga gingivalis]
MTLSEKDQQYLWHAYTQHKTSDTPIAITKGKDALLWDENGNTYIDAIASWWVNPYGHSNERLAKKAYEQLTSLEHVLFGGFTHQPACDLAEALLKILPKNQSKVFFSDNGSTAVEVAVKIALQYYYNQGEKRTTFIAFEEAFHGDTFAAMAVSGISLYTTAFQGQLLDVVRIPIPEKGKEEACKKRLLEILSQEKCAGFIFEPLVMGAAGMRMYAPEVLDELIQICREHQVLTIADEVMTGFGKTGKNFACDYLKEMPDMICLSKALTGGTIPLSVTTTTEAIYQAFYSDDISKALFHGHTFMANPTGCAIALESLKILAEEEMQDNLKRIHAKHVAFAAKMDKHPKVARTRTLGVIFAMDLKVPDTGEYYGTIRNELYRFYIDHGVILRPVYHTIYILPPYIMTDKQLDRVYEVVEESITHLSKKGLL